MSDRPVFYYDLNSPYSWLAAERIHEVFDEPPVWRPISYPFVIAHTEVMPWSVKEEERPGHFAEIDRRIAERGLPAIRYPDGWPLGTPTLNAMRAATFAQEIGKVVSFSLAAFRQLFNAGRSLAEEDTIILAGAACEIHPKALLPAIARDSIKQKLKDATNEAIEAGVTGVPTVRVDDELFWGDERLEEAAAAARSAAEPTG
jgi:2-hydroxychromene-2-carboxylate isomerase